MKGKPIKIDWDELESAFNNRNEDLVYYLDTVTGHVLLEGEGEESEFEDEEDFMDEPSSAGIFPGGDSLRLLIEPPGLEEELSWMKEFIREGGEIKGEVLEQLNGALEQPDAHNAFRDALRQSPDERDLWYEYRSGRLHEAIDAWLDANGLKPSDPPPWRS